jgi:hypothetical protein
VPVLAVVAAACLSWLLHSLVWRVLVSSGRADGQTEKSTHTLEVVFKRRGYVELSV